LRTAILAGGGARRFGGKPKGHCTVGGVRILDRVVALVTEVTGSKPILCIGSPEQQWLGEGLDTVIDVIPEKGTLGGIFSAITHAEGPVLLVAWDMPFLTAGILENICSGYEGHDVFLPASTSRRGVEPLCGVYGPKCTAPIEDQLHSNDLRAVGFHDRVKVGILPLEDVQKFGQPDDLFFNVNSDDDLKQAEEMWLRLE
jgi:molybdopterin-guanine dinucleotide biosynthesis protein A